MNYKEYITETATKLFLDSPRSWEDEEDIKKQMSWCIKEATYLWECLTSHLKLDIKK